MSQPGDTPADPTPGTLRYAVTHAARGAAIRFAPALHGRTIELGAPIHISADLTIEGPGANLLTISGRHVSRLFVITGGTVRIAAVTLADGMIKGADGGWGAGSAGGGGGAAGMGGGIFLENGALTLDTVVMNGNSAIGGAGGAGGSGPNTGTGGAGGALDVPRCAGGAGGGSSIEAINGAEGDWGCGGGGGGFRASDGIGSGGAGGGSAFGGGSGGNGGFSEPDIVSTRGIGGAGGSGFGGAIFVSSGLLQLIGARFVNNSAVAGAGVGGAQPGLGKGGAIFVCARDLCGPGHEGAAIWSGATAFSGNTASEAGGEVTLPGRDDADVCGYFSSPVPAQLTVLVPPNTVPGESFPVTVVAVDSAGLRVLTYSGIAHLTSSDRQAVLPPDAELSGGVGVFTLTMNTPGAQTVTASILTAASVTGTSKPVAVNPNGGG